MNAIIITGCKAGGWAQHKYTDGTLIKRVEKAAKTEQTKTNRVTERSVDHRQARLI